MFVPSMRHANQVSSGIMDEEEDEAVNAVFKAAREGDVDQVEMLLDGGPNLLEAKGSYDHRPLLFEASAYGHVGVVKHLLRRGANVNAENMPGVRSIHQAASHGHADVVEVLLGAGAEISIPHMRGPGRWTALMAASLGGHKSVTQVLVHHMRGRGLNERDRDGRTALWWACQYGRGRVTRVLLLAGADRTIADNMGLTPRQIAQMTLGRNPCVIVLKRWDGELERPYSLHRARCIYEENIRRKQTPTDPVPAYLEARMANGGPSPTVRLNVFQKKGALGKRKSQTSRRDKEEERHAMVRYVIRDMAREFYVDLMEGFHRI